MYIATMLTIKSDYGKHFGLTISFFIIEIVGGIFTGRNIGD